MAKIGEYFYFQNGYAFKSESFVENGNYKVIKIKELKDGKVKFFNDSASVIENDDELEKYTVKNGDVLFALTGDPVSKSNPFSWVGRVSLVDFDIPAVINQRVCKAVPKGGMLSRYLYYFFRQDNIFFSLAAKATGSASQANISTKTIEETEIDVPSIETQRKVVDFLSAIDRRIVVNEQINKNLYEQAQLLFKSRFFDIDYDNLPAGWHIGTVEEIIELHDSKRIPLSGPARQKMEKKYPYYGATSLMDYVDNYIFDGIYLLLGEDGTVVDAKGFPILQYIYGQFWVNNHAHILTGKSGYSVEELYLFFSLTNIQNIVTGAVQQKISQQNLKKVPAIVPSIDALKEFDDIIQPMFTQIRNLRDENESLSALRDSLLPQLMSGELDVSSVNI